MDDAVNDTEIVTPPKKGGMKKLLMLGLPVLLLAGGGGWWMFGRGSAPVAAEEINLEVRGLVPLETFLVNLSDQGGNRFLKATIQLAFDSASDAKHVEENAALMGHARSTILELLTQQTAPVLVTAEGKQKLKEQIRSALASVLKKQKVVDVLFSEFVVQF